MNATRECIKSDRWEKCLNTAYKTLRDELTCLGKLVLRESRIVFPEKLHQSIIDTVHEGHHGRIKTKERLLKYGGQRWTRTQKTREVVP